MTGDKFMLGYIEGREWAVNWAGEGVLQRLAGNAIALGSGGSRTAEDYASRAGRPLDELTTLLMNRPLAASELRAFWKKALPDAEPALLHDLQFLRGFLEATRHIAREPR